MAKCKQIVNLSEGVYLCLFLFFQLFCKFENFQKNVLEKICMKIYFASRVWRDVLVPLISFLKFSMEPIHKRHVLCALLCLNQGFMCWPWCSSSSSPIFGGSILWDRRRNWNTWPPEDAFVYIKITNTYLRRVIRKSMWEREKETIVCFRDEWGHPKTE